MSSTGKSEPYVAGPNNVGRLKLFVGGKWIESKSDTYSSVYNASTGELIAESPECLAEEVNAAVEAAKAAFEPWWQTPANVRVQVLFRYKALLDKHIDEIARILSTENGKTLAEAVGEIQRGLEITEFACGAPTLLMGESLENVSHGIDVVTWRQPLGVCVGIVPFNFPAMIPMWMFPIAIACGNTFVLKAVSIVPNTAARLMQLLQEAGLPDGVVNMITCGNESVKLLIEHPDVKAVSFVGSTKVGRYVYQTAAAGGKRVQALTEAKNHALVMPDCILPRAARAIVNAAFGCAGERCMALSVVVAHQEIADELVELIVKAAKEINVADACSPDCGMGPLISSGRRRSVLNWIENGIGEGAELILDGRDVSVPGCRDGFFVGPTIFDNVTQEMSVGREEIFGPVLCIKRVSSFEEGLQVVNASHLGNGSAIFTQSGRLAREFAHRAGAGMVGINVAIPVPLGFFSFTGWKNSFFGDLHSHGKDGVLFFTEKKSVTYRWFEEADTKAKKVNTWD
jgi:malonate-semialdehyde dehydrogenase (acetylating)/methylmalonate-semialdehyde dehydrogenase